MLIPVISTLLIILSAFMWVAINSNILSYQSTAISQQSTQQFLAAEYALTQAEHWLQYNMQLPKPVNICIQQPCILIAQSAAYLPPQPASWWQGVNNYQVTRVNMNMPMGHNSFYAIEELVESSTQYERYFRITSWSLLTSYSIPSVLQSVWMKSNVSDYGKRNSWRQWG
jgi:Tfp pilus assembly protein PilX